MRFRGVVQTIMLANYVDSNLQRLRSFSLSDGHGFRDDCDSLVVRVILTVASSSRSLYSPITAGSQPGT